jgi:hypothetical protein
VSRNSRPGSSRWCSAKRNLLSPSRGSSRLKFECARTTSEIALSTDEKSFVLLKTRIAEPEEFLLVDRVDGVEHLPLVRLKHGPKVVFDE